MNICTFGLLTIAHFITFGPNLVTFDVFLVDFPMFERTALIVNHIEPCPECDDNKLDLRKWKLNLWLFMLNCWLWSFGQNQKSAFSRQTNIKINTQISK